MSEYSISSSLDKIPKSGIRKLFDLAQNMEGVISLGIGEPDFSTPSHIIEASINALKQGRTYYSPNSGLLELRQAISKKMTDQNKINVSENEILVTVGGGEALSLAIQSSIKTGNEVIIPSPAFVSYIPIVMLSGGNPIEVECKEEESFILNSDILEENITENTELLILNSPSNPTGSVMTRSDLEKISDIIIEYNLKVISDEVYESLIYGGKKHISIASLNGMENNVITVNSFSKTYSMTGWRVGYLASKDPTLFDRMLKLHMYGPVCNNTFAQFGALEALNGPQDYVEYMRSEFEDRRNLLLDRIKEMNGVRAVKPEGAFYVFMNISETGMKSEEFSEKLLNQEKVVTVPGSSFGQYSNDFVRLAYPLKKDKINEASDRMKKFLSKN
ncbi:MAG: putative aspartate aminotransferase 2 [Candidatus Methanofastidiosum methylothiophilum]|jgi:aminotransferase|uniref:Aminotransferase n=1 Tax=Candidatus Methanofastidiosum methylothiophilum TaxID=1705564 RepID=A0A150JGM8_9EURY|nr:MAG: putative aspartate aminotransferase 2 [Candidatus Methanofastidiosum methylthiophilus]MBP6932711.1 pyridoxal phosphate-dependent aminotransferase [Methanofastidiosum sp.]OQC52047.1 MAG: putative aspartate aminotransferase 2 [Euryarchaeota archaeon ADurb.Bin023]KYC56383.1 MAG: putative aspartate aminotransferase 2 [Candidatus Methanofastidiosum methylthiophilus]KYC57299.1 MAG: putative aspartate aminotransferase 2 [Candidatus Methanofastidiosum methylthiophilus]